MHLLSECSDIPDDVKFLSQLIDKRVSETYNRHGYTTKEIIDIDTYEGEEITDNGYPWIEFRTSLVPTKNEKEHKLSSIYVVGNFGKTTIRHDKNDGGFHMASDEHAEFTDLLKYVKNAKPKVVVTDNYRSSFGKQLANEIQSKLGIPAKSLPE